MWGALDTGRHRALVVVDPRDRRNLKGFLYLSGVHSEALERAESEVMPRSGFVRRSVAERRTLQGLADKMSERTGVRAQVLDGIALDDPRLMQVPFLLLTVNYEVAFTQAEAKNLGRYLTSGRIPICGDCFLILSPFLVAFRCTTCPALRDFIRQAFAANWLRRTQRLVFCAVVCPITRSTIASTTWTPYPRGFHDIGHWYVNTANRAKPLNYLEGH